MNAKMTIAYLLVAGMFTAPVVGQADDSSSSTTTAQPTTSESTGQYVDDATITTKVKAEFLKDSDVSAFKVKVKTKKGVVWLHGTVKSQDIADKAVSIAQGVEGVKEVKSRIKVKAD